MLSNENPVYKNGFKIDEINCKPGMEFVKCFTNGVKISLGQEQGGSKENVIKIQIKETIKAHFEKEIQLKNQGIKVLVSVSFWIVWKITEFINKVRTSLGTYGKWFEEIYMELSEKYKKELNITPVSEGS